MSTLTLDFTDSSFDDGLNNDGITEFVLSNNGGGLGVFAAGGPMGPDDAYAVDENINVAAGISAMEITTNAGTEFTFEFIDDDDSGDRSTGDDYSAGAADESGEVFNLAMNEQYFADGLDITNGGSMEVTINYEGSSDTGPKYLTGELAITASSRPDVKFLVDSVTVNSDGTSTATGEWGDYVDGGWMTDADQGLSNTIDLTHSQLSLIQTSGLLPQSSSSGSSSDDSISYLIGDEGGNDGETTWVVSGDMNGRVGTATDDSIGFKAGKYDGVFLGGDGFDTLKFSHDVNGEGQLYIDLTSGMGMFGNGQSSPIVKFAEIGPGVTYDLDWERLETEGSSNDYVIVGGGLNDESTNDSVARGGDGIADGYFELDLGSGQDTVMVTDSSSLIALDLSATDNQQVNINNQPGETTINVGPNPVNGAGTSMADHQHMEIRGEAVTGQAVVDLIDFGAGTTNNVDNMSSEGVIVDFGTAGSDGPDGFDATTSSSSSNMIDLRNDGPVDIVASVPLDADGYPIAGDDDLITITNTAGTIDIEAMGVDAILVGDDTDTDVLVNHEHLYGDGVGVLGFDVTDADGSNYDVATSASLGSFNGASNLQIFYDGDHTAFTDTGDALTRDASTFDVATVGVNGQQEGWEAAVADDHGNSATPSFFVVIAGKKVAVHLDTIDDVAAWKVDTSAFTIASDASIDGSLEMAADKIAKDYGIDVSDIKQDAVQNIYLNASESDIQDLLGSSSLSDVEATAAFDFGFYTQVKVGEGSYINVAVKADSGDGGQISWSYDEQGEVLVQTDYNTVDTASEAGSAAVGGTGADFIELGTGSGNIAMGNAGSDTYVVDAGDSGIINELGKITNGSVGSTTPAAKSGYAETNGDGGEDDQTTVSMEEVIGDDDSVKFELVEDIADLNFSRGKIAGEKDGSTLFIDAGDKGAATLFDQYNDFLAFRKTEFLVIDDGATSNEVFELVTGDPTVESWANEIYVADDAGGDMAVDVGGVDHIFLGSGADNVMVDLDDILSANGSVTIHNIDSSSDTLEVGKGSLAEAIEQGYADAGDISSAEISFDAVSGQIMVELDDVAVVYDTNDYLSV